MSTPVLDVNQYTAASLSYSDSKMMIRGSDMGNYGIVAPGPALNFERLQVSP